MAVSFVLTDAARDLMGDVLNTGLGGGTLVLYETATTLVTFTLPAAGGNTSVNGVITLGAIAPTAAAAAGTANIAKFFSSAAALLATANVGIGSSYAVNLDNNVIASAQVVTISSCVITVPAGT
jgi:hypothetical protein